MKKDYSNHLFGMTILNSTAKEGKKGATIYATDKSTFERIAVCTYSDERTARKRLERLNRGRE